MITFFLYPCLDLPFLQGFKLMTRAIGPQDLITWCAYFIIFIFRIFHCIFHSKDDFCHLKLPQKKGSPWPWRWSIGKTVAPRISRAPCPRTWRHGIGHIWEKCKRRSWHPLAICFWILAPMEALGDAVGKRLLLRLMTIYDL